jgi:flagellar basal body-associated protein FliL
MDRVKGQAMAEGAKDKEKKKEEAKSAEAAKPAAAEKKKLPIKLVGAVAILMVLEGAVVYTLISMTSPKPVAAEVEIKEHEHAAGDHVVEIALIEDKTFQNMLSGRTWNWTVSIVLQVKQKNAGKIEEEMGTREAEIQEGISRIIARAQLAHLQDPDLRVIERQIGDFLKTIFEADVDGHSRIERILIPVFTGAQRNF